MAITVTAIAKAMSISRSSVYYVNIQPIKDLIVKQNIKRIWLERNKKTYGSRRIARELNRGKNSVLRVMKKFNLYPVMRKKRLRKKADENKENSGFPNMIEKIIALRPNQIWATDFTYILFHGSFVYLATVLDIFTREIVGYAMKTRHTAELVCSAMKNALDKERKPEISHSDQGSENRSQKYVGLLQSNAIIISMSHKASPWENSHQEAFYSQFKLDFGNPNRFEDLGELMEAIGQQIRDYNETRRHSSLGMIAPAEFRRRYEAKQTETEQTKSMILFSETQRSTTKFSDFVCQKTGA